MMNFQFLLDEFQGLNEELRIKIQNLLLEESLKAHEKPDWFYNVLSTAYRKLGCSEIVLLGTVYRALGTPSNSGLTLHEEIIPLSRTTYFGTAVFDLLNDLIRKRRYDMCLIDCPYLGALILGSTQLLKLVIVLGAGNVTFNCFAHHDQEKSDIEIKDGRISYGEKFIRSRFHRGGLMHVKNINRHQFVTYKSERAIFIPSLESMKKSETKNTTYLCSTKI